MRSIKKKRIYWNNSPQIDMYVGPLGHIIMSLLVFY